MLNKHSEKIFFKKMSVLFNFLENYNRNYIQTKAIKTESYLIV